MLKYVDSSAKKKKQNKRKVRIPEEFLEEPEPLGRPKIPRVPLSEPDLQRETPCNLEQLETI
jgi:hypothetical protein